MSSWLDAESATPARARRNTTVTEARRGDEHGPHEHANGELRRAPLEPPVGSVARDGCSVRGVEHDRVVEVEMFASIAPGLRLVDLLRGCRRVVDRRELLDSRLLLRCPLLERQLQELGVLDAAGFEAFLLLEPGDSAATTAGLARSLRRTSLASFRLPLRPSYASTWLVLSQAPTAPKGRWRSGVTRNETREQAERTALAGT